MTITKFLVVLSMLAVVATGYVMANDAACTTADDTAVVSDDAQDTDNEFDQMDEVMIATGTVPDRDMLKEPSVLKIYCLKVVGAIIMKYFTLKKCIAGYYQALFLQKNNSGVGNYVQQGSNS